MVGLPLVVPEPLPRASIALTISLDASSATSPKTTCLPSNQPVITVVMKNWEPLLYEKLAKGHRSICLDTYVFGPALAMDRRYGLSCFSLKFSSANFSP